MLDAVAGRPSRRLQRRQGADEMDTSDAVDRDQPAAFDLGDPAPGDAHALGEVGLGKAVLPPLQVWTP
ncbi:MAG TPA: hypothetical protein VIZ43_13930 [Trebonia sp.]|jgi:hypothetical protein